MYVFIFFDLNLKKKIEITRHLTNKASTIISITIMIQTMKYNLPEILSHKILDVIILPNGLKSNSRSGCVIFFGSPDT